MLCLVGEKLTHGKNYSVDSFVIDVCVTKKIWDASTILVPHIYAVLSLVNKLRCVWVCDGVWCSRGLRKCPKWYKSDSVLLVSFEV